MFYLNFIKTKIIDVEFGKLYSDLFDWRQKGDYGDFFDFNKSDVESVLIPTKNFINKIREIINYE